MEVHTLSNKYTQDENECVLTVFKGTQLAAELKYNKVDNNMPIIFSSVNKTVKELIMKIAADPPRVMLLSEEDK